jgi:type IV secretion system protein VirD4
MRNYAGHRLSPWLGHLMVSRQESARHLLTPGEVMQLPPADELVLVSGCPPIRARKARYFADARLAERIASPPALHQHARSVESAPKRDDWNPRELPPTPRPIPEILCRSDDVSTAHFAEEDANGGIRREPELPEHEEIALDKSEPHREFALFDDDLADELPQTQELDRMRGVARQAALDPGDDLRL